MRTFLKAYWQDIVMVNYEVQSSLLQPYLPTGTMLDDFEGKYYVSLVGFKFLNSSIFGMPIPIYGSFNEVNLRFYVKRIIDGEVRRGVVFISEIVPSAIVAFLANKLYKEHYTSTKMSSAVGMNKEHKILSYKWWLNKEAFSINTVFSKESKAIESYTHQEFIYEHYYGFTKVSSNETWEYKVNHPSWKVNEVLDYTIHCNFENMYGEDFKHLTSAVPHSVYNAVGSAVTIDWKINKLKNESNKETALATKNLHYV
jgi:uncharacterized protein